MYQCSKQIKPYWKLHESICLCHLNFGHLVIVSDLVLRYSDFQSAKNAKVLAPLRGFPHTTSMGVVTDSACRGAY